MPRAAARPTRERLVRLLDAMSDRRLIAVVADAGAGKTAAVQDWTDRHDEPTAWVLLPPEPSPPAALLRLFVSATAEHCAGLAEVLAPELAAGAVVDESADPEALGGVLAGALAAAWGETSTGRFTVVVDDLHVLDQRPERSFVTTLARLYPRSVRMILLSRTQPTFGIERLRGAGEYGEIGQRALLFDAADTSALFAHAGVALSAEQAATIADACAGWASAVAVALATALAEGLPRLLEHLATPHAVAQHLTDIVLGGLDGPVRDLLVRVGVLGSVPSDLMSEADVRCLDDLAERALLVTRSGDAYALTSLAGFAIRNGRPPADADRDAVLRSATRDAIAAGRAEPALRWARLLGDPEVARDVVAEFGTSLLDAHTTTALAELVELVPQPSGDDRVEVVLTQLFARRGEVARAVRHLDRIGAGSLDPSVAWRVAMAFWMQGETQRAAHALARAADTGDAADLAQVDSTRATLAWDRGDGPRARELADHALVLAERSGDGAAQASAWVAQALVAVLEGDLTRNSHAYEQALRHAQAAGDVLTEVRVRCNRGSRFNEVGRYAEALVELDEAVRLGEATGQTTRIALARLNQGQSRLGLGRLDEAVQDINTALGLWTSISSPMAQNALQARGDALARRGDAARAAAAYREAIALAEVDGSAQVLVPALAGLARVRFADDPAEAEALALRARESPASVGSTPALLASGWIALCTGDREQAAGWAAQASDSAGRRTDPAGLSEALLLAALADDRADPRDGRLVEAAAIHAELGNPIGAAECELVRSWLADDTRSYETTRARLRALGVRDSIVRVAGPSAVLGEQERGTLVVQTLGSFVLYRDGRPVPASAWQSRKARDLVKILAGRRGKAITRDSLAELLWPDSGGDTGNRLSVALSTARSVLDPDREYGPDHYLAADRDAVRLNLRNVSVDIEDFTAKAEAGLAAAARDEPGALALLEAAAAAYAGDFAEEDRYEEWPDAVRDDLRARRHHVLRVLADTLAESARPDDAVPWLIALLGDDPHDEASHLQLVRALVRAGRHGEARRAYATYAARMSEIEVEPAAFPQRRLKSSERVVRDSPAAGRAAG